VHHRIKNSIASIEGLLSIQAKSTDNDDVRNAPRESIARIQTTRVLDEKLLISKNHRVVSRKNYIGSLIDSLIDVFPDHRDVSIKRDVADIAIASNKMITVSIGIPAEADPTNSPGFGLTLVTMLAKQLHGSFPLKNDHGTRAILKFEV
jgi:two-component sensor histidine kinase